jgi:CheY-like chemotaxis protein
MSNRKILIVEDDADVRLGYRVLLRAQGYDTFFAADSIAAISEARKHLPDLIILDLGLPAGDGFVVMERLQAPANVIYAGIRNAHWRREQRLSYRSHGMTMICSVTLPDCLENQTPTVNWTAYPSGMWTRPLSPANRA